MTRVLHLINHCGHANGNVHAAVDLACAQRAGGHEVALASAGGHYEALLSKAGVRHVRVVQNVRQPRIILEAARALAGFCREFQPDLVHAHMMSGAVIGYALSRWIGRPLVTTVHNSFDWHSRLMRLGDATIAVSQAEYDCLARAGFRRRTLHKVLNGPLQSPRYAPDPAPAPQRERAIGCICGLHARKGVGDILAGFAAIKDEHPDWSLVIGGEGPDMEPLVALSRTLGIADRTTFLGVVKDPMPVLQMAEIFVIASLAEPFGLTVVEARRAGCAIIGTKTGGIPEILGGGRFGLLVEPNAPEQIASALRQLIGDEEFRTRLQARTSERLAMFAAPRLMSDHEAVYAQLPAPRRTRQVARRRYRRSNADTPI